MGDTPEEFFNLISLLKIGDLNVRHFATNNGGITTQEYFSLLSKVMETVPLVMENLTLVTAIRSNDSTFEHLSEAKEILKRAGCTKYISSIDNIIRTLKKGDKAGAAAPAKKLYDEVNRLWASLQSAKKTQTAIIPEYSTEVPDDEEESVNVQRENYPLKKVIQNLEIEEETRKLRILAVDDAVITLKIVTSILGDEYTVYGMKDPRQVVSFLQQTTPELFLLDYRMPEISGFDLIPIIRGFEEHKDTPIIFLTSLGTVDTISSAVALGACDFIVKPIQAAVLKEKIAKHISRKWFF